MLADAPLDAFLPKDRLPKNRVPSADETAANTVPRRNGYTSPLDHHSIDDSLESTPRAGLAQGAESKRYSRCGPAPIHIPTNPHFDAKLRPTQASTGTNGNSPDPGATYMRPSGRSRSRPTMVLTS